MKCIYCSKEAEVFYRKYNGTKIPLCTTCSGKINGYGEFVKGRKKESLRKG